MTFAFQEFLEDQKKGCNNIFSTNNRPYFGKVQLTKSSTYWENSSWSLESIS